MVPTWALSWLHPDQKVSALRAESVGPAQCPRVMGGGSGQTGLPLPAPEAATARLLDLGEGKSPALATLCPPPHTYPECAPRPPSRFLLRLPQRPTRLPHLSPSAAVVFTHPFALLFGRCCREETEEWGPLLSHGPLSVSHAYVPVVPVQADQAAWGRAGWKALA